jgi:uncharacterized BrkB/YihY/UPF0761 family membrane protein
MQTLALVMGWIIAILLGSFALVIIFQILIGRIELKYLISGPPDNNASLARFQFLIFTFVIAMGLFLIIVSTQPQPAFPAIPGGILALLGISGGSYVTAKGVDASVSTTTTTTSTPNPPPLPPTTTTEVSQPGSVG